MNEKFYLVEYERQHKTNGLNSHSIGDFQNETSLREFYADESNEMGKLVSVECVECDPENIDADRWTIVATYDVLNENRIVRSNDLYNDLLSIAWNRVPGFNDLWEIACEQFDNSEFDLDYYINFFNGDLK